MSDQRTVILDVETYPNFWLALFLDVATKEIFRFQISPNVRLNRKGLVDILNTSRIVGFNSAYYDIPLVQLALQGYSTEELKDASDDIIVREMRTNDFRERHGLQRATWNHIDLIEVAPLEASLKLYAGRLHCRKLQDLPYDPDQPVTAEQAQEIFEYCCNDLRNTATLFEELGQQIALREELSKQYRLDLRSKSDAQIAEHIISAEIERLNGALPRRPQGLEGQTYKYRVPEFISYQSAPLLALLEKIRAADFRVGGNGAVELPEALKDYTVKLNGSTYRIGIGGLHSSESSTAHVADGVDTFLIDKDVTSYYPSIILRLGLYPAHLGEAFLTVYRSLVERRIAAKQAGDKATAESLKIAVNGSFGKLGSKYSALYSPDLLIQVTVTGQLSLLMLIERLEEKGVRVVSANTDGIVIKARKHQLDTVSKVVADWESKTGFATEETRYRALYSKDVNNYIAIKPDGKTKNKGLYANPWEVTGPNIFKLHKNPCTTVVIEAVVALLRDGTPLEQTIRGCTDVRKFTSLRTVRGGAMQNGKYLGKVVRWYQAVGCQGSVINYKASGNKVPKSDMGKPLMELPDELPGDIDFAWYINEARVTLQNIGYSQMTLFQAA